ncbi:hypothetical protein D3C73_1076910 [compost metagenome]
MNKKTSNLFVKLTAKHPLPFIGIVTISIAALLGLTLSTQLNTINTYNGVIDQNNIIIHEPVTNINNKIYVYTNRNEFIYPLQITDNVEYGADTTTIRLDKDSPFSDSDKVKVDVGKGEITLFERVFLKGGKVNHD